MRHMTHRWQPAITVKTSVVLHAALGIGTALVPQYWPQALALLAANHGVLAWGSLWPRSSLLGPNLIRLPAAAAARNEIALTFDDGPHPEITPQVLDMLDQFSEDRNFICQATFFCIGATARRHPALIRSIVARGHRVENHTDRHPNHFSLLGPRGMAREITAAQHCLADLSGRPPKFFRAVAGLRNVFLEPILAENGLTLATWSHRAYDTVRSQPGPALQRLAHNRASGDILLLHDGHAAITASGQPLILEILPLLLAELRHAALRPVTLEQACAT